MEDNFSERFEIIYQKYCLQTAQLGTRPNETAFGRYMGVSKTTVQRWKGGQVPASRDIKTIHDKLEFAYDWLISGEGEMFDTTAQKLEELVEEIQRLKLEQKNDSALANVVGQE